MGHDGGVVDLDIIMNRSLRYSSVATASDQNRLQPIRSRRQSRSRAGAGNLEVGSEHY